MEKPRLRYFDLISGLFMIQIIAIHVLQFSGNIDNVFYTSIMHVSFFFMPWFYFKSGYFYSPQKIETNLYLRDKFKKLLLPFFIFAIIGFLLSFPFELIASNRPIGRILLTPVYAILRWGNGGDGNLPIWFLLSLFFSIIGFNVLNRYRIQWLIIVFPLLGYALYYFKITLPLGLSNIFLAMIFLYGGNVYKTKIEQSRFSTTIIWLSAGIYLINEIFCFSSLDMRTNALTTGYYFVYIFSAFCGTILMYCLGKKVDFIKPLNYVGENSMAYFVVHWPILILIKNLMERFSFKTTGLVYAGILSTVFLILPFCVSLLNGKLKFLIGK